MPRSGVAFERELAVMVVRTESDDGELTGLYTYPAVETVHEESICTKVFYPPRGVPASVTTEAGREARKCRSDIEGQGRVCCGCCFYHESGKCPREELVSTHTHASAARRHYCQRGWLDLFLFPLLSCRATNTPTGRSAAPQLGTPFHGGCCRICPSSRLNCIPSSTSSLAPSRCSPRVVGRHDAQHYRLARASPLTTSLCRLLRGL